MLGKNLSNSSGATTNVYVDDVFSAYTYTGNGANGRLIQTGIDLSGKGGLVVTKARDGAYTGGPAWVDTARGNNNTLFSGATGAQTTGDLTFNANGHTVSWVNRSDWNTNTVTYASWTFRKAPKFFDVVTYTGNGSLTRNISHSLGVIPGMVIIKRVDATSDWKVSVRGSFNLILNSTAANGQYTNGYNHVASNTATTFSLNANAGLLSDVNTSAATYVAYLFAHDPSAEGIVQCGSFTTDASGTATVNLGWEPQFVLQKAASTTSDWWLSDTSRGLVGGGTVTAPVLAANTTAAEGNSNSLTIMATGFTVTRAVSTTYVYMAIRRPNKPPTVGTQVYNAIARTGTGAAATVTGVGFAPDLAIITPRTGAPADFTDRLRGAGNYLFSTSTAAEAYLATQVTSFGMDGVSVGASGNVNPNTAAIINHFFKRAPGVFDEVCWVGDNTSGRSIPHQLSVSPELVIWKNRTSALNWPVYSASLLTTDRLYLNLSDAAVSTSALLSSVSSSDIVAASASGYVNASGTTYVAYLWASKPGISKVGSYTGNGSSQTINCGFTTGARFILIKRTDSAGDWFVFDTVRGIVAGNDPHLSINTTVAEVTTDDSIDPGTSGFIVNQVAATNINVTSATYIYLAFA